jgi:hypothetical protein
MDRLIDEWTEQRMCIFIDRQMDGRKGRSLDKQMDEQADERTER